MLIVDLTLSTRGPSLRRQILTYKDGPRNERIKTFMIAVDP